MGFLLRVGEVHAVRPACLAPDHAAQALIGVSRVHQHDVRTLFVVLPHEVVHEERLAAARRTQHELVAVRGDAPLHGQVADVEVQRFTREPVHHLDAEGRERRAVIGFLREQAHRLLDEGMETLPPESPPRCRVSPPSRASGSRWCCGAARTPCLPAGSPRRS